MTVRRSRLPTPVGGHALVTLIGPKIAKHFFKKCPQLQSKSSETCSDTSLTLLGTSSTTLFMIMIRLGQYFEIFEKFGRALVATRPQNLKTLGEGGHRDRLTVTNLRAIFDIMTQNRENRKKQVQK